MFRNSADSSLGEFDLIYCRMVLHHLQQPELAIEAIRSVMKPSTIFVCEEPIGPTGCFAYPDPKGTMENFIKLVVGCFEKNGVAYDVGVYLHHFLNKNKMKITFQGHVQPLLIGEHRHMFELNTQEISPRIVSNGLADETQVEMLAKDMKQLMAEADAVGLYRMFQYIAVAS
ncbi:class I SAM-dependent methyltransferase [Piscirickettsia salmonis]|uniref:class I SAM-dependent methyltransferase n=2 Tax=Piscirickettsia salmonis TaxID=1238 RepID=UPI0021502E3D|nr:class I SAM-dependent methyltransferase [Piscirickettsia salmonis]